MSKTYHDQRRRWRDRMLRDWRRRHPRNWWMRQGMQNEEGRMQKEEQERAAGERLKEEQGRANVQHPTLNVQRSMWSREMQNEEYGRANVQRSLGLLTAILILHSAFCILHFFSTPHSTFRTPHLKGALC